MTTTIVATLLCLAVTVPLAWKWQLGVARCAAVVVALGVAWGLVVSAVIPGNLPGLVAVGVTAAATLASALALTAYRFFRDPERQVPDAPDAIVSPAEGDVVYVRRATAGELPVSTKLGRNYRLDELTRTSLRSQDAVVIGISMSFLDVHVNRAPLAGRVTLLRHFPGRFGSLRQPEMVFENERATTVLERGDLQVAVVQIASRLVRGIVSFVEEGQAVTAGQRIGVIRFGSQVDLVLPDIEDLEVTVKPGDHVLAGSSVVARCPRVALTGPSSLSRKD